jgi:Tfp pilus assembly protein PilO
MKFSNSFLFVVTVLVVMILFFIFLYRPANEFISYMRSQIHEGHKIKEEEEVVSLKLEDCKRTVAALSQKVNLLSSQLLKPNDYLPLMKALRSLCKEMGFRNESIAMKGQEYRDDFEVAVVELSLKGGFEEIYRFIVRLEELELTVQIELLEMQGEPQRGDWIEVRMRLCAPIGST